MINIRKTLKRTKTLRPFILRFNSTTAAIAKQKETLLERDIPTPESVGSARPQHNFPYDHSAQVLQFLSLLRRPSSQSENSLRSAVNSVFNRNPFPTAYGITHQSRTPSVLNRLNGHQIEDHQWKSQNSWNQQNAMLDFPHLQQLSSMVKLDLGRFGELSQLRQHYTSAFPSDVSPNKALHHMHSNEHGSLIDDLVQIGSNKVDLIRKKSHLKDESFSNVFYPYETEGILLLGDEVTPPVSAGQRIKDIFKYEVDESNPISQRSVSTPTLQSVETKISNMKDSISQSERDIVSSNAAMTEIRARGPAGPYMEEIPEFPQSIDNLDSDDISPQHDDATLEDILRREEEYPSTELQAPIKIPRPSMKGIEPSSGFPRSVRSLEYEYSLEELLPPFLLPFNLEALSLSMIQQDENDPQTLIETTKDDQFVS